MATSYDLFFSGNHDEAKRQLGEAFEHDSFTVQARPDGNWVVTRGSATATFWLGAMAGKKFRLSFELTFFVGADGQLVVRFNRNLAGAALRGGAIGANMSNNAFNSTYSSVIASLQPTGLLARSVAND